VEENDGKEEGRADAPGGTHADKRRKPRPEEKRLAIREALSRSELS
jgi:hypothetical protein